MNRARICSLCVIALLFLSPLSSSQEVPPQESAEKLYEAALFKKEAEGDLEGAIKIFQRIVEEFATKRKIAAKAQLQIGKCLEKLGLEEAMKAYQKVIDNYPDQTEAVLEAREKISILLRTQDVLEKRDTEFKIKQIWAAPDTDHYGAPSKDGRYLSYVDWRTGDLALFEIATGNKRHLTKEAHWGDPSEYAFYSIISPDGKRVAYSWYGLHSNYGLRVIGIDGTGRRTLYSDEEYEVHPVDWSSDGKQILVQRYNNKGGPAQILWISALDGSVRVLKTLEEAQRMGHCMSHSPDDCYIAYEVSVKEDFGNYDIHLLATDGSSEIPLIKHKANDRLLGWAPGRKDVLFLSDRTGTWDAFVIRVDENKPLGSPKRIKPEIGRISPLGFTEDGSLFYGMYTRWFNTYIAKIDLEEGVLRAPLYQPIVGSNLYPEWSPDGLNLAYISEQIKPEGPGVFDDILHIHFLKTGKEREIQSEIKRMKNPRWSPNGRNILVTGRDRRVKDEDYQGGLYLIDAENGHVTSVVKYAFKPPVRVGMWGTIKAEWSPDGKAIFYITRDSILRRELKSGQEEKIYQNPHLLMTRTYARLLTLSPDGEKLVFGIRDPETHRESLWILPSSGGEARPFLELQKSERIQAIDWTPDGEYVLFTKREKNGTSLWRIATEGQEPQKIWESDKRLRDLRVHPEGTQIAFSSVIIENEVWVMENFLLEK
jgi:Tol biopolymer transport system component